MATCNGFKSPRDRFSTRAVALIIELLPALRRSFQPVEGRQEIGVRCRDVDTITARIESATTELEFLAEPTAWVLAALDDCASADYYYTYEKDYGQYHPDDDEIMTTYWEGE
jgi:hypothetical protein